MARGRVTRDDWTLAALRALARGGVAAVSVDALAGELDITRGSFYWHFKDREALLVAALELWEQRATADVITRIEPIADPAEQLRVLLETALGADAVAGLEPALLAHSDHPVVAPVLTRVVERRIGFLTGLYRRLGLDADTARRQAVVAYAAYLGWADLRRAAAVVPEAAAEDPRGQAALRHLVEQLSAVR
ncbi:TetR/AcrR family transcriptional regulator [Streptomonospora sp. S1-112]|uniref:TetR/AcrR family transcriptional regulator n=1 Tax=Streptomonospora mangrovi TaxID=2883123 RepID=A0A9X3NMQ2_9ACTN|nr:TetR/AcrR family transcriptional regulator [Streptomonospora mangrovi]MDA0563330.1 TetR/AcrR family transcriptional regulator [Streptomonospora mangrovi]